MTQLVREDKVEMSQLVMENKVEMTVGEEKLIG